MHKFYVFDEDIKNQSVIDFIDNLQATPADLQELTIYFCTNGGIVYGAFVMADFIIKLAESGVKVNIIVLEYCYSSGLFFLMHLFKAKQKNVNLLLNFSFLTRSYGLFHEIEVSLSTRNDKPMFATYMEDLKDRNETALKFFKKYMTKDDISNFRKGGYVYFDSEKLCKIFGGTKIESI